MLGSILLTLAILFAPVAQAQDSKLIKVDGSSTVFPLTEAVSEEFQAANRNTKVTVGISGTGGGFKKFCRGETDVQNASRPIQGGTPASEMEVCKKAGIKYFEVPVAFDAMAIIVNPSNTWLKKITIAELKKMWEPGAQGKITKWNQVNPTWPDEPLKLYGAGSDSGTFDYFTEAVVGKAKASRGDYTASEDDNTLVKGVAGDKSALGYVPFSYYAENKKALRVVPVVNPKTKVASEPSRETVESGVYAPLARPLFIYVNEASYNKPEVKAFVQFYLEKAPTLSLDVKEIPLPQNVYKMAMDHLNGGKIGTVFKGHSEVGIKIEDLMKKEKSL